MSRPIAGSLWIVAAVVAMGCVAPEAEKPVEPPAEVAPTAGSAAGPDSTVVDAAHYKAEFENERVRIVRITYGPGEESVMHYHPEAVAVFLTPYHVQFRAPDGTTMEAQGDAGQHLFTPAENHWPKNIGAEPLELVLVELKSPGTAPAGGETGPDPVTVDAGHYKAEFENERVRILRIAYGPGEASVMHHHPDAVAVFLTPHHVQFTAPDGSNVEVHGEAKTHAVTPAGLHLPKNIGTEPLALVLVELK